MARPPNAQKPTLLDAFESTNGWRRARPTAYRSACRPIPGFRGRAMRLDFDFHGGGGYAVVQKAFNFTVPANYEFSFRVRGDAPPNTLEFKLDRPERRQRVVVQPARLRVPAHVDRSRAEETTHHVRVGTERRR